MNMINSIDRLIVELEKPILQNIPFFVWMIFLLISPTLINAYWINGSEMSFSYIQMTNRFGAAFPYILFVPFVFSFVVTFFLLLLRMPILRTVIYVLLVSFLFLNLFLLFNFSTMLSPMIITLLSETTGAETKGFLSTYLFSKGTLSAIAATIVMVLLIILTEKIKDRLYRVLSGIFIVKYLLLVLMIYLFYRGVPCILNFLSLFSCKTPEDVEEWSHGFKYETNTASVFLYSLFDYRSQKYEVSQFYKMMSDINKTPISSDIDSVDIVLIIGESYNKYHAGIYDYFLNTTPFMSEQKEKGRLLVFDNAVSPYNMTSFVIKNMLSTNSISNHERWSDYPFFPILFKSAGYSVYFWDNQMVLSGGDVSDFSINALIHNKDISLLSYTKENDATYQYDGDLVDDFSEKHLLSGSKNLIIFHLLGQHFEAKDKYPHGKGFDVFTVGSYTKPQLSKSMLQEVADYDNATRYNDYVVMKISDMFKDRPAVIVYLSDHGEEVYDYREFIGRTHEEMKTNEALKYQYDVPFVVWFSEKYLQTYIHHVESMESNIHKPFLTDDVSQLLLGLGHIRTVYYHSERDLSSADYKEKKRIVQNTIEYDYQMRNK